MKFKKSGQADQVAGAVIIGQGLKLSQSDGLPVLSLSETDTPTTGEVDHGTITSSITPDLAVAGTHIIRLGGNITINNPLNAQAGHSYAFLLVQDSTGGRNVTWGNVFKWPNGIPAPLSTDPNAIDIITCIAITVGGNVSLYAVGQRNFS